MKVRYKTRYFVDKENGVVACRIYDCKLLLVQAFRRSAPKNSYLAYENLKLSESYVGKAACTHGDEWDEQFGRQLAFAKARRKLNIAIMKKCRIASSATQRQVDNAVMVLDRMSDTAKCVLCDCSDEIKRLNETKM